MSAVRMYGGLLTMKSTCSPRWRCNTCRSVHWLAWQRCTDRRSETPLLDGREREEGERERKGGSKGEREREGVREGGREGEKEREMHYSFFGNDYYSKNLFMHE